MDDDRPGPATGDGHRPARPGPAPPRKPPRDGEPCRRTEILHESERTRVSRVFLAEGTVIRKEPLGPDRQRRLQHEAGMLERLCGVPGIARLLQTPRFPGSIVLEDVGGTPLAGVARPLALDELIGIAVELVRAVGAMHRRGVMHRDITPANIVISDHGTPCLVDFALATSFAELRPEFTHHKEIVGTLAYLAPEQSGRTGRSVDQRADLYALGATLYELATGEPPFGTGDPLQLTHDHLARVPVSPSEVNREVPGPLSEIVLHLLEKEPDNRYQTAEGVLHDLERLRDARAGPGAAALRIGENDFPLRLVPPSRLVGRDAEVAALQAAFEEARAGRCRGVLVGGAPGVGKTALVNELRPVVTGRDGWFLAGKFDQYRRDLEFNAFRQAFGALGRLLLAEPEDELAEVRERIRDAVGANAGLLAAVLPEFAALLAVAPDPGDPLTAQVRAQRGGLAMLRAVATLGRPVMLFIDDLQWAGRAAIGLVDMVLTEEPIEGLLLVGAYRDDEVDAAHPLAAPLVRWREQAGVQHLRLLNLSVPSLTRMAAEMLHADQDTAAGLIEVIEPHTHGNPYETVELLNLLRRDGVLSATADGWRWDEEAARAHLDQSEVAGLLAARLDALEPASRVTVEAMACLGGRAELSLLQTARAAPASVVDAALAPAIEDGLLVVEPGVHQAVRFRHDRTREVILRALTPQRRGTLQLAMARRLAAVPDLFVVAAEQYLAVVDAIEEPAERRLVVGLLRRAADQARLTGDHVLVSGLLSAALRLIDPGDAATLVEVHTGRHAALYSLGRLDEADEEYRTIEALCPTATERADATVVQVLNLTQQSRLRDAIDLGLDTLRELGITVPAADELWSELDHQFEHLYRWLDGTDASDDLVRPDITDPGLLAASRLINAVLPPAYFVGDHATNAWLSLEALRIWLDHGPGRALVGPGSNAAFATVALRGDYSAGYRVVRRILSMGEARGYEPDTSQARFLYATLSCWFEPIEDGVLHGRSAREGLIAAGDVANAGYAWQTIVACLMDCAPSLDVCVAEVEAALAFARRTGGDQGSWHDGYRRLAAILRGEDAAGEPDVPRLDMTNPLAVLFGHITGAMAAAVMGDPATLTRHTEAAMPLLPGILGSYPTAVMFVLRGLALAEQARTTDGDERGALVSQLDHVIQWLAAHATTAPANFLHLLRLLEAERAWTAGDFRAGVLAFDAARREVARRRRPWHRALIAERAARFHLAHGVEQAGHELLIEARGQYLAWGATAKVDQLDWAYPTLRPPAGAIGAEGDERAGAAHRVSAVTVGTVDLLGILSVSQALSSETSVGRLHGRVVRVLGGMTGATGVHLMLWSDDRQDWVLPAADGSETALAGGDGADHAVPWSVLRYAQRMPEPLVVGDATRDDRFARDPYFAGLDCCSLLAVPVLSRGVLRAVLLLENRLIRGAFTTERLDAVRPIAAQLAVSLDNARLYSQFRRIADEQAALRRVAMLVARAVPPEEVFAAVAEEAGRVLDAEFTFMGRYDTDGSAIAVGTWARTDAAEWPPLGVRWGVGGQNVTTMIFESGRPARIGDYADSSGPAADLVRGFGVRSCVGVPVTLEGRLWGLMTVMSKQAQPPADTEARLAAFTELVATAIANAEAQGELTASRARIVATADATRRRIERDLHDGAQQRLVSLALQLRAARAEVPPELGDLGAKLDRAVAGAAGAVEELRETARGIHPAILVNGGLRPALRTLAGRSPIPVDLDVRTEGRLPDHVEVSAYYVVAEALTNAAKHAEASAVTVSVEAGAGVLSVLVRDDGRGGADLAGGTGLVGLKDRVEAIGGRIVLDSPRGEGTSLRVELPLTR